ncbi:type II toxin-antitoxin system VapB family antitoxin [Kitasatospora sp. NPDC036755]|uniref:type II toxin-antitoxin system VapB family antitoxin n=1 Tax=Kitasatospora sp. NPDC036755 TaxID=3154600 RepID=UPI0033CB37E4
MGKTVENIDEPFLDQAQKLLGTSSNRDTVNAALREVVRQKLALSFIEKMRSRDPEELERLRGEAWR